MSTHRQSVLGAALGRLVLTAATAWPLQAYGTPTFANVSVHDPSVVRDGSTYYVFGSHLASASTTDLMYWTQITNDWNATNNPTCILIRNSSPQTEFATALAYTVPPAFWGPNVIRLGDGRYYFYYCVCNGTSRAALGLAVADAITGPYANVGIMLESGMTGLSPDGTPYNNAVHPNVVDPTTFFDNSGNLWMVYGSYSGGIFILSLDPATGQPYAGQAYGKKLIGGNNSTIEGPFILYSPESAYYYLFFTFGGFDSTGGYNIRAGRSRNPDGPYVDAAGNDLTNVEGAPNTVFDNASIAPYGVKLMGNYQFLHVASEPLVTSIGYVSPGGTSASYYSATGRYLMVFHTRFVGQGEHHEVRVHQMFLNADGWFVVAPQRYAQEAMATTDVTEIPGDFKLINHGKDITATVKTSTVVTFNADGSVTGASAGTWQLSGDHFATLTLGGISYHGVFAWVWDDDNQLWTLGFTAISTDGVAVWGTKTMAVSATPVITVPPSDQTAAAGQSANFHVTANGGTSFQWQESANGGSSWTTLADTASYTGTSTATLTIVSAGANLNGFHYRVIASNAAGSVTSGAAALTVNQAQVNNSISYNSTTFPATATTGATVSFTCNVTNTGANTWGVNHYLVLRDANNGNLSFASLDGVGPGASTTVALQLTAPASPGTYTYYVQGLENNVAYFSTRATLTLVVSISAGFTADFNGDGKADVLWSNTASGDRYFWLMNGGSVTASIFLGTIAPQWTAVTGDFNGDGKADLLWSNSVSGDRYFWLMNGGSVTASIFLGTIAPQWTAITGDFDGDGKADILWSNSVNGDRYLWLMNGGSVGASIFIGTIAPQWTAVTGDFNGDGKADVLWSNSANGDRYLWLMSGGSVAGSIFLGTIAPQWTAVAGDFNGDGKADLLWSNSVNGDRYVWLMNGGSVAASLFLGTVAPQWMAVTGDFNGDGNADLVWSSTVNGDRYLWLMNGGSVSGSIFLGTVGTQWRIGN